MTDFAARFFQQPELLDASDPAVFDRWVVAGDERTLAEFCADSGRPTPYVVDPWIDAPWRPMLLQSRPPDSGDDIGR